MVGFVTAAGAGGSTVFLDFLAVGEAADAAAVHKVTNVSDWQEGESRSGEEGR